MRFSSMAFGELRPGEIRISQRYADNGFCSDWLVERGGFEPPVSREVFPKENTPECWDILGRNPLASCRERVRFQIATVSVVKLKFRCREIAAGSKNPIRRSQVFRGRGSQDQFSLYLPGLIGSATAFSARREARLLRSGCGPWRRTQDIAR